MEWLALATLFSVMGVNAMIPGVITVAICARSAQSGVLAGLRILFGVLVADLISLAVAWVLLCHAIAISDQVFAGIKFAGAVALIPIAIKMFRDSRKAAGSDASYADQSVFDIMSGLLMGIACPFTLAFMFALLPQLVPATDISVADVLVVSVTMTVATALPLGGLAFATMRARQHIERFTPWFCTAGAASLIVFAGFGLAGVL